MSAPARGEEGERWCWEDGPLEEDGCATTCLRLHGHEGPHKWWRDDNITLEFVVGGRRFKAPLPELRCYKVQERRQMTRIEALNAAPDHFRGTRFAEASEGSQILVAYRFRDGVEAVGVQGRYPSPIRDYRADRLAEIEALEWHPYDVQTGERR